MSSDVTAGLPQDVYGQVHPIETEEMIVEKLEVFEGELKKLPEELKKSLRQAEKKCPEQLTNDFKLMFLRTEVFNAYRAAKRYASYWENRVKVCGTTKAFLPLTLDGAFKDDGPALSCGVFNFVAGQSDSIGRAVIYIEPGKQDGSKYSSESMARAAWYVIHAALESPKAQKHGIVVLVGHPEGTKLGQFDKELTKRILVPGALPARLSAVHICQPPAFVKIIMPFVQLFLSERLKKRFHIHFGSNDNVCAKLASYGMSKTCIPQVLGGNAVLDGPAQ